MSEPADVRLLLINHQALFDLIKVILEKNKTGKTLFLVWLRHKWLVTYDVPEIHSTDISLGSIEFTIKGVKVRGSWLMDFLDEIIDIFAQEGMTVLTDN